MCVCRWFHSYRVFFSLTWVAPRNRRRIIKKREKFVKDVAEEVRALQAAERRADCDRKMAAKAGPRPVVTFNLGSSPPPSDSNEEALEANLDAGISMPFAYTVRSPTGLQCLLCNGSGDETINFTKWALGTPSPAQKHGEAKQHISHGKHLQAFEAAKRTPSLRHLLPLAALHPWHHTTISGCAIDMHCQLAPSHRMGSLV